MAYSEDHIALAAEYALGTLDAEERTQVETMMAVDNEFAALGISVTTNDPINHPAMIFDSSNPTGGDWDLGTPNQAFGGPGRSVLAFPPTYSMHGIITRGTGTTWLTAERDPEYRLSAETAVAAIERHRPDIVFLCAPNNPTGTPVALEVIEAAYEASDGMVFVDEAYAEFMPADAPSALTLLPDRHRLLVSRTMSKAFAFAGARVGYLAADPAVIDALRLVRLPYHLSALTQAAAVAALRHAPEMLAMVDDIRGQRDRLLTELPRLGYRAFDSWANFVLFDGLVDPHATFEALLERDVIIRDVGLPGALRVTAGTEQETTLFLDALRELGPGGAR